MKRLVIPLVVGAAALLVIVFFIARTSPVPTHPAAAVARTSPAPPAPVNVEPPPIATAVSVAPPAATPAQAIDPKVSVPVAVASDVPVEAVPAPAPVPDLAREDRNRETAVDLFADKTLALEEKFSDDPDADENPEARRLREFREADKDDGASELEQAVGDHLREWMAAFPTDVSDRLVLVSVDCRIDECQVLLAELGFDMASQSTALGATILQGVFSDAWWRHQFEDETVTTEVARDPATTSLGNAMLTIYATRHPLAQ